MPKKKKIGQNFPKKVLDKMSGIRYNEPIKNEVGDQSNPFYLTEKRNGAQKTLDVRLRIRYNEPIKNEIGN